MKRCASAVSTGFAVVLGVVLGCTACSRAAPRDYSIRPVAFTEVELMDGFWRPRMQTNRAVTIKHALGKCEESGRIDNFAIAGGLMQGEQRGTYPFDDTDLYKTLEGASYALMLEPDAELEAQLDRYIEVVAAAQDADGYLYTARANGAPYLDRWSGDARWAMLHRSHELYNAGHLFEAAVANFQATGKRDLLDVALRFADLIDHTFGPDTLQEPPGHQVVEMGLVKLYRVTGERRYLELAKHLLDVRGRPLGGRELGGEYNQDHQPVVEQEEAVGHAVRAGYMYAGMADVAALTGDRSYIRALHRLWDDVVGSKLYITGGIGASGLNEGFGEGYDLPNMSAYNETCASIANVFWNHRLFLLHGDGKYLDVMERTLYNALLAGVSLDGSRFFYPNPLESVGQHERSEWFGCACCPGNVARFMSSLPGYVYAVQDREVFVNLYVASEADVEVGGQTVHLRQQTRYPWHGVVRLEVDPAQENEHFSLRLRIPGWARGMPVASALYRYLDRQSDRVSIKVNGAELPYGVEKGFVSIRRRWRHGDVVTLELPMPVRRVVAHAKVESDAGKVALERGPIVYCAEWADQPRGRVRNLLLPDGAELSTDFAPQLLNGVQVVRGEAVAYRIDESGATVHDREPLTMIPYHVWAHRGKGEMAVWLYREESVVQPLGLPSIASTSRVTVSFGRNPEAVNDQLRPENSHDYETPFYHWYPHRGTTEWVQYDFAEAEEVSMVEVFWFDEGPQGDCRVPASWRILFLDDEQWVPVYTTDSYGTSTDQVNRVTFETVRTRALRLEVQSQEGAAGGMHEWTVH